MADRKGDPAKRTPDCKIDEPLGSCPNIKTVSETWSSETRACTVCGERYTLHDDEMK